MVALSIKASAGILQAFEPGSRLLVIETGATTLLISLWDTQQNSPLAVEFFTGLTHPETDWEPILQTSSLLRLTDVEVRILVNTSRVLPIPALFYYPAAAADQLSILQGDAAGFLQKADILAENDMVIAWEVSPVWPEKLAGHFSVSRTQCLGSLMVQKLVESFAIEKGAKGIIAVDGDLVWMALARDGQLLLLKSIDMPQPDDFAYHLMNACHQWGIDKATLDWEWWGRVDSEAPLLTASQRFLVCTPAAGETAIPETEIPYYYYGHHRFCLHQTN
jgi:hypothetical protein